jgi:DNA-directed RNA polymerase specialized sigma24 family protein
LRLAALLVPDVGAAHEVMYEAFAALQQDRASPRGHADVLAFLLWTVVHRARAAPRADASPPGARSGEPDGAVVDAVRALSARQREALVLRYYGQFSDEQVAAAMGVRPAEVRSNVARGMLALRATLGAPGRPLE